MQFKYVVVFHLFALTSDPQW